jgi:hypothetical protein
MKKTKKKGLYENVDWGDILRMKRENPAILENIFLRRKGQWRKIRRLVTK